MSAPCTLRPHIAADRSLASLCRASLKASIMPGYCRLIPDQFCPHFTFLLGTIINGKSFSGVTLWKYVIPPPSLLIGNGSIASSTIRWRRPTCRPRDHSRNDHSRMRNATAARPISHVTGISKPRPPLLRARVCSQISAAEDRPIPSEKTSCCHGYLIDILPINFRVCLPENLREQVPFDSKPL